MYVKLSIELELNTRALLGTSWKMTSLLELTTSLAKIAYFTGSTHVKDAVIEATSTKGICTKSSCIGATSIGDVKGAFIRGASVRDIEWDILLMWPNLSDGKILVLGMLV